MIAASTVLFAAAMGAHESGVIWLAAAVLVRYGAGERLSVRDVVRDYWPSLLAAGGFVTLTAWINSHNYVVTEGRYRPGVHVVANLFAYLTALYAGHRTVVEYAGVAIVVAVVLWKGSRPVRAWCGWLFAALLPVLAFTTPPASRYLYVPAIPFCLLVAGALVGIARAAARRTTLDPTVVRWMVAVLLLTFVAGRSALFARKGAEGFRNDAARYEEAARQMVSDPAGPAVSRTDGQGIDPQYIAPMMRVATCDPPR